MPGMLRSGDKLSPKMGRWYEVYFLLCLILFPKSYLIDLEIIRGVMYPAIEGNYTESNVNPITELNFTILFNYIHFYRDGRNQACRYSFHLRAYSVENIFQRVSDSICPDVFLLMDANSDQSLNLDRLGEAKVVSNRN